MYEWKLISYYHRTGSNVKNIYNCVERAGLQIDDVILEPIASADAVLNEEEAGIILDDIGGGTTV